MKYITVKTGDELLVTRQYFLTGEVTEKVTYVLNGVVVKECCTPRAAPGRPTP
jgi:hypothetical protein